MVRRIATIIVAGVGIFFIGVMANAQGTQSVGPWERLWNNSGGGHGPLPPLTGTPGPAPRRDLTGVWDAGTPGIFPGGFEDKGGKFLTPEGRKIRATRKNGLEVGVEQVNDPLETLGDVGGFPRNLHYELRPFEIVQTSNAVLMLHMWEKRWRKIWTDGRMLPKDPDPRWYGYSVGRWIDDTTFVVESNGMDERAWLDHHGNPISPTTRVEERWRRVNAEVLELTITIEDPAMYTQKWTSVDKFPIRLVPPRADFMEMIPSASEAQAVHKVLSNEVSK